MLHYEATLAVEIPSLYTILLDSTCTSSCLIRTYFLKTEPIPSEKMHHFIFVKFGIDLLAKVSRISQNISIHHHVDVR